MRRASRQVNRRAFLRGAFGASVALPFLESLPERSAWAAGEEPVFSLFIGATCGVVPERFFPAETGVLTADGLATASVATSALANHAENLLFVSGVDWVHPNTGDAHAMGYCQLLTASQVVGADSNARASGPSADIVIASKVHPDLEPLTLYAGTKNAYMAERLSFGEQGTLRAAANNPYTLYLQLMGLVDSGGAMTPDAEEATRRLLVSRNSVHDLVRGELDELMNNSRLSMTDRQKLQQHFQSIRDFEVMSDGMGDQMLEYCTADGLDVTKLEALQTYVWDKYTSTEETAELHMSLVALAFACDYRRVATLQWGEPYDQTIYRVASNDREWRFSWICHRGPSDSYSGTPDPLAEDAHAEIDVVRMQTLAKGLEHFEARGLAERSFVLWTNCFRDGPGHSFKNIPHILWGSGGGYLRHGGYVDVVSQPNDRMLNTLITAATQATGSPTEDFGDGPGGLLDPIIA